MKELLDFIVKNIVRNPDSVEIVQEAGEQPDTEVYIIKVKEEDKGILIGKAGRTINAIRDIAKIKGIRDEKRVVVRVE
ncbi:MAG TPA: KH domain-containing protein [Candidatus Dojkabacteria bacterium]|nr:KH domain-containing protein [Candidatus Dojkabacteria bacterium]